MGAGLTDPNRAGTRKQHLGLRPIASLGPQHCQVVEVSGDVGMLCTIAPLVDSQRPAQQRLGRVNAVAVLEQARQAIEVTSDPGMVGAVAFLIDGKRPAQEAFGLGQALRGTEELR